MMDQERQKWEESIKQQEKWENSLEGIWENLNWHADPSIVTERYKKIVCKTLQKIPKETRDKILEKTLFLTDTGWGCVHELCFPVPLKAEIIKQTVVTFNFSNMEHEKISEESMMDVIAHECAHVILGHHTMEKHSNGFNEREADNLSKKWGFKGTYTEKMLKEVEKPIPKPLSEDKVK